MASLTYAKVADISRSNTPDLELRSIGDRSETNLRQSETSLKNDLPGDNTRQYLDGTVGQTGLHSHPESVASKGRLSSNGSQMDLIPTPASTYTFDRYIPRSTLNTLGPLLFTVFYVFIVLVYLLRPATHGIIPWFPIKAKGIFYAWLILSIFVLDWAKSGLAGFEASALMKRKLAPQNAMQLMWHADRAWGSVSGWWKALVLVYKYLRHPTHRPWKGPSALWWYLSFSSFLFYAAVPLAGISMDPKDALHTVDRRITILGTNQTSFDMQVSNSVAEQAKSRWMQGKPTTPDGETIFYAPSTSRYVSATHYEDAIQRIYNDTTVDHAVQFFSGPQVSVRAHGRAWGLLTNLSCSVTHPYTGLDLLHVDSIDNWTTPYSKSSRMNRSDPTWDYGDLNPWYFSESSSRGVNYKYLTATDRQIEGGSDYINASSLPINGSFELVMWQTYESKFKPDGTFQAMPSHPSVVSSKSSYDNLTYLGYAVRCSVDSLVGFADLNAATRTYSHFGPSAAEQATPSLLGTYGLSQYPGILAIQSLVFAAFTTVVLEVFAKPVCGGADGLGSTTCDSWFSANIATGGTPLYISSPETPSAGNIQYPTISPERMMLAVYKLFGEVAIEMMASGPGNWTGELCGLDYASDLVPGIVPWQVVLVLLVLWSIVTALPNLWTFKERRWAATLDGFEMFRLGSEWTHVTRRFEGSGFEECEILSQVPGMVGDMEQRSRWGVVGLSRVEARKTVYVHDRGALQ